MNSQRLVPEEKLLEALLDVDPGMLACSWWERMPGQVEPLLAQSGIASLLVLRRHEEDWTRLTEAGSRLDFSELPPKALRALHEGLWHRQSSLTYIPLIGQVHRLVGCLVARSAPGRRPNRGFLQGLAGVLGYALAHGIETAGAARSTDLQRRRQALELESERSRLAGEIHDTVAQALAGILAQASAATGFLERGGSAEALHHLKQVEKLAREGLVETRRSLHKLRPLPLATLSLAKALEKHVQDTAQSVRGGLFWRLRGRERGLPQDVENEIFRIAQESLRNAIRHSQARLVRVELNYRKNSVLLSVQDDGVGLAGSDDSTGLGLHLMRQRAERIGARLEVNGIPQGGTSIVVLWKTQ